MTPWTIQFIEFSWPEYWNGLPFPFPGDLPNPGIEPRSLGFLDSSVGKESACNAGDHSSIPGSGRSTVKGSATHSSILGLPCGSAGKEFACNAGDLGLIPGLGRSPGEGKGYLLQYSGLENSTYCIVHGVAKSRTQRNDSHFTLLGEWKCHM